MNSNNNWSFAKIYNMKTIIIDDEPLAQALLKELLEEEANIDVVATCNDGFDGLKAIQEHQPDLIFLDVKMPKITGFELLELLENPPLVIFTTAYDEYALKAFEVNALDYLLKPFDAERLHQAVEKVSRFDSHKPKDNQITYEDQLPQLPEQSQRIVVKEGSNIKIIPLAEVLYIEAANDYAKIFIESKFFLKHQTMQQFENQLPAEKFVRVHRSYIINLEHLQKIELYDKGQSHAILRDGKSIPLSRNGKDRLKTALGI